MKRNNNKLESLRLNSQVSKFGQENLRDQAIFWQPKKCAELIYRCGQMFCYQSIAFRKIKGLETKDQIKRIEEHFGRRAWVFKRQKLKILKQTQIVFAWP